MREQRPDTELAALDRLVGTWRLTGGAEGEISYRWLEGGHFLIQDLDLEQGGHKIKGIEVIGRERPFGAQAPGPEIRSRVYDHEGNTLDYVYELQGDTLTIWGGEKGSPAYMRATFSADGATFSGGWVWPGGGYEVTGTRVGATEAGGAELDR
jgi:hypothetical protein